MKKRIGFLGCGKIGQSMLRHLLAQNKHSVSFVQDIAFSPDPDHSFPVVTQQDEALLAQTDLVVECATASVLRENLEGILKHCDLLMFSVTAFSDPDFEVRAKEFAARYGHKIYLPHGAILGVDGIFDGRMLLDEVKVVTTKNPSSLGRQDVVRTVVYEGPAREACKLYPRNVNVHATIALAGIGFDRTTSTIISDPDVNTNSHKITVIGQGIHFELDISSFTSGGVTGEYTPCSACGSLDRVLQTGGPLRFV